MASTDARPIPQKNVAYRITFPIFDADGDLVTGATGLDSEVSKDGAAFADCTNEATEVATSSGMYYLDLTSTEMNADTVAVIVKTSSSGAKTTPIVMYPEEAGDIRVNVTAYGGTAGTFSGGRPEVNTTHAAGTAWASGAITSGVFASGAITSTAIAADAIGASELAADAVAEIADAVWDEDATAHQTQGTFGQAIGDPVADTDTIWGLVNTNLNATVSSRASQTSVDTIDDFLDTEVAAILADTNELQTDWANGGRLDLILDARASQTSVDTVDDFLDTEIAAIKAKTDQLTFTVANQVDSNALSGGGGLDAAGVRAAVGLASANLDTQLTAIDDFVDTEVSAIKTVTDKLDSALELDGAVYRYTTNALEQAPTGGSAPTVAQIADAVWDEDTTGHTTAGTFGEQLKTDVDAILVDTGTTLDGKLDVIDDFLDTEVAAIKAKTDNLPADPADASDITSSFSTVNTKLDTIDDFLDTEVAAIKAKTDNLPASPASTADIQVGVEAALDGANVELGAVPATTGSLRQMIQFLHSYFRNKKTVTTSTETLMKEDASTALGSASISDDGTTFTKGEMN